MGNPYDDDSNRLPRLTVFNIILFLLLAVLLVFHFWPGGGGRGPIPGDKNATTRAIEPRGDLAGDEKTNIEIFEQCSPCTVHVRTFANVREHPFSLNILKIPKGSGTGFIWDIWEDKGRVVTNFHVVRQALRPDGTVNPQSIQVTLADQSVWNVVDVNYEEDKDLAVLWTEAPADRLRVIKVGESQNLKVGQKVYAIGNPFGLDQSLTTGIISALGREISEEGNSRGLRGLIQTDAAINPGNSGGPLLDSAGRLIGVNTAIVSPSGASAGIGFAIPVDEVNRVVTRLIRKDQDIRPAIGIHIAPDQILQRQGLEGVLVIDVVPEGPAAKAGIRPTVRDQKGNIQWGDIIIALDGKKVHKSKDLLNFLEECKVGQEVKVTVRRGKEEIDYTLTLTSRGG